MLINGIYPLEYFQLKGVDPIAFPNESWWASAERYARVDPNNGGYFMSPERGGVPSTEYQEIDLGRVREVNLLTFDIAKMPFDITVEYDALSSTIEGHKWVPVTRLTDMPFDNAVNYEANARNAWKASRFYFTDGKGRMIHTRYLRIAYTRRYDFWPTRETLPFPYSAFVKNLRTARYIAGHSDTVGPLFDVDLDSAVSKLTLEASGDLTKEVRQRFVYPENAKRGNVTPALLGFSVLVDVEPESPQQGFFPTESAAWQWRLMEITDPTSPILLDEGVEKGVSNVGKSWLDIKLNAPISGSLDEKYELRLQSLRASASGSVYTRNPNTIPGDLLPSTFDFVNGSATVNYDGIGLTSLLRVGDTVQIVDSTQVLVVSAVTSTSMTLSAVYSGMTAANQKVAISQSLYAPANVGRVGLLGTVAFVNGQTVLNHTPAVGDEGLTYTAPVFAPSSPVPAGHRVYPNNGYTYEVVSNGTTGGTTPTWPTTIGDTVVSGTVTFRNAGINIRLLGPGDYLQSDLPGAPLVQVASVTNTTITLTAPYIGETEAAASADRIYSITGDVTQPGPVEYRNSNLVMRVWADVADSGRDVLGNAYRYATHRDTPERVFDGDLAGWMSAPQPSPEAVEAMYFDVRSKNRAGAQILTVLDGLNIAPRTPGVRMQVYYNKEGVKGRTPQTQAEWDHMMWTPINEIYVLRKDNAIELPESIKAAFVKLEFTNLRPMPFKLPSFPEMPPVEYRRYPTWVEDQFLNTKVRKTVEDWFLQTAQPVQLRVLESLRNPVQEFAFKQRAFLTALAQGQLNDPQAINNGLVDVSSRTFVDPVSASKIYLGSNSDFRGSLVAAIKGDSILGNSVRSRFDSTNSPLAVEANFTNQRRTVPLVSNVGSQRITDSFAHLAETPMWFNRRCRHLYRIERATFNKKAYYVGIRSLQFVRNNYTVEHDDKIIEDTFHDDAALELNSFVPEVQTTIPNGTDLVIAGFSPVNVFVSYTIGTERFTDEPHALFDYEQVTLTGRGLPATDIRVYSATNSQGTEYDLGNDYITSYDTDQNGNTTNTIGRSSLSERLIVDATLKNGHSYRDAQIVTLTMSAAEAAVNEDAAIVEISFFASGFNPHDYYDVGSAGVSFFSSSTPSFDGSALTGTTDPAGGLGSVDDRYVNTTTMTLWIKRTSGWELAGHLSSMTPKPAQEQFIRTDGDTVMWSPTTFADETKHSVDGGVVIAGFDTSGDETRQSADGEVVTMFASPVADTYEGAFGNSTYDSVDGSYDDLRGFEDQAP